MTGARAFQTSSARNLPAWLAVAAFLLLAVEGCVVLVLSISHAVAADVPARVQTSAADQAAVAPASMIVPRRTRAVLTTPTFDVPAAAAPELAGAPLLSEADGQSSVIVGDDLAIFIDGYLDERNSPLIGLGAEFVRQGRQFNVDPRLLVAISGNETGFGRLLTSRYNAFNWFFRGMWDSHFSSWNEAIATVTRGIRQYYFDDGRTSIESLGEKYGPIGAENDPENLNVNFIPNVTAYLLELGADPQDLTFE